MTKRTLFVAAIAAALVSSPAGAETKEAQLAELARVHNELLDRAAALSANLYRKMAVRWRTKAALATCGEPVPANLNDWRATDFMLIELANVHFPNLSFEELMPIFAAVHIGETYFEIGYADALRLAFRAGLSRDLVCQGALDAAKNIE